MFDYYHRLSPRGRAVYRESDRLVVVPLREAERLRSRVTALRDALAGENRKSVAAACQNLVDGVAESLSVPPPTIQVLSRRPTQTSSELHGLYERSPEGPATIRVWMRTSQRGKIVAFRTFLRTLLHELCHHLDYELFKLPDSLHTEGFFKRESSLYKQLTAEQPATQEAGAAAAPV